MIIEFHKLLLTKASFNYNDYSIGSNAKAFSLMTFVAINATTQLSTLNLVCQEQNNDDNNNNNNNHIISAWSMIYLRNKQ